MSSREKEVVTGDSSVYTQLSAEYFTLRTLLVGVSPLLHYEAFMADVIRRGANPGWTWPNIYGQRPPLC